MTSSVAWFGSALISDCHKYRYQLERHLPDARGRAVFIMLNPSTADALDDDPTIRRCKGFALRESCGTLVVVNLYAYRSTDPKQLRNVDDPVGVDNDKVIRASIKRASIVIAAWGTNAQAERAEEVIEIVTGEGLDLYCLGTPTKNGSPRHPLYLRSDAPLTLYRRARS